MGKNILIQAEVFLIDAGEVQCPEKLVPYLGDLPDDIAEEAPENAPSKGKGSHSGAGKLFKISDEDGDVSYSLVSDTPPYSQDQCLKEQVILRTHADAKRYGALK